MAGTKETELQIVDRASGAVTPVVHGGLRPSWSRSPNGPIAFLRITEGRPVQVSSQEIWLVNPDGSNPRKLSQGGSKSWSRDGRLFFFTLTSNHRLELRSVMPDDPENSLKVYFEIEGYPTVSPDGTMVAYSILGKLIVRRLADNTETLSLPLAPDEFVFADWSPDGRFIVTTSGTGTQPGVWLIEVASEQRRLLAKLSGTRSSWSPDGRSIAVEESSEKKIVLLDVSSLSSLWKDKPAATPNQP